MIPKYHRMLEIIARNERLGRPCPSNDDFCLLLNWASWSSASRGISSLTEAGYITFRQTGPRSRVIKMTEAGWRAIGKEPPAPKAEPAVLDPYPVPADFFEIVRNSSRIDAAQHYGVALHIIDNWMVTLTPEQKRERAENVGRMVAKRTSDFNRAMAEAREEARAREALRERDGRKDIHAIIAREAAKRAAAAAARPDPYAGLSGFDRSLAIARDRGIQERPVLVAVDERTFAGISSVYDNAPGNG